MEDGLTFDDRLLIVAAECLRYSFAPLPQAAIVNAYDAMKWQARAKRHKEHNDGLVEPSRLEKRAAELREGMSGGH